MRQEDWRVDVVEQKCDLGPGDRLRIVVLRLFVDPRTVGGRKGPARRASATSRGASRRSQLDVNVKSWWAIFPTLKPKSCCYQRGGNEQEIKVEIESASSDRERDNEKSKMG